MCQDTKFQILWKSKANKDFPKEIHENQILKKSWTCTNLNQSHIHRSKNTTNIWLPSWFFLGGLRNKHQYIDFFQVPQNYKSKIISVDQSSENALKDKKNQAAASVVLWLVLQNVHQTAIDFNNYHKSHGGMFGPEQLLKRAGDATGSTGRLGPHNQPLSASCKCLRGIAVMFNQSCWCHTVYIWVSCTHPR